MLAYSGASRQQPPAPVALREGVKRCICLDPLIHRLCVFLVAFCKRCWIYFSTPLKWYIFKGSKHRVIMYNKLCNVYDRYKTQRWTQHGVYQKRHIYNQHAVYEKRPNLQLAASIVGHIVRPPWTCTFFRGPHNTQQRLQYGQPEKCTSFRGSNIERNIYKKLYNVRDRRNT